VLWGGSFFFNGVILKELPPLTLVLLRVALASLILLPLLPVSGIVFPKSMSGWMPFFAIGLFNNVLPFGLIVTGQTTIPSGLASILNATTPLFIVMVMAAAGEETLRAPRVAGVVAGMIGVIILHGESFGFESGQSLGILLCLAAAFSYGLAALVTRRLPSGIEPLGTATFQMLASAAMMIPVAGLIERPWQLPMPGLRTWAAVAGLAALSTALAYIVFFQILRRSGATNVMLVTLLIPVTALLLGAGRARVDAGSHRCTRDRQRIARHRRAPAKSCPGQWTPAEQRLDTLPQSRNMGWLSLRSPAMRARDNLRGFWPWHRHRKSSSTARPARPACRSGSVLPAATISS
jgi:drug/metabolite transporter (DMT)-like permease